MIISLGLIIHNLMFAHAPVLIVSLIIVFQYILLLFLKKIDFTNEILKYSIVLFVSFSILVLFSVFIGKTASITTLAALFSLITSLGILFNSHAKANK